MDFNELVYDSNTLEHYGRKGMKWGQHLFMKDPEVHATKLSKRTLSSLKKERAAGEAAIKANSNLTLKQLASKLKKNNRKYDKSVYRAKEDKLKKVKEEEAKKEALRKEEDERGSKLAKTLPKDLSKLGDADLKKATERLVAEQRYKELYDNVKADKQSAERLNNFKKDVTNGLGAASKLGAQYVASYLLTSAINKTTGSSLSPEVFSQVSKDSKKENKSKDPMNNKTAEQNKSEDSKANKQNKSDKSKANKQKESLYDKAGYTPKDVGNILGAALKKTSGSTGKVLANQSKQALLKTIQQLTGNDFKDSSLFKNAGYSTEDIIKILMANSK